MDSSGLIVSPIIIKLPTTSFSSVFAIIENLSANSRISILIDNRRNKPIDIEKTLVVTAVGISKEIIEKKVKNNFLKKHPYLRDFINSQDCAMIEISIEKYIVVDNFENVTFYKL